MRHVKEHIVKPIPVLLLRLDLARLALCHGGRSIFDADIRIEGVLVEENRTARKVGHVKSFLKNIVFDIIRCFLQGDKMTFLHNLFLKCVFFPRRGPGFQL